MDVEQLKLKISPSSENMPMRDGEKYPAYSIFRRNELMRNWYHLKLAEGESIKGHISTTKDLLGEISSAGPEVEEDEKVCGLLHSLPDSWDGIVATLFAIKNTVGLKFDPLCRALEHEEQRRNSKRVRQSERECSQVL